MINLKKIISLTNQNEAYVIDKRRSIHQNPELSFQEENTSKLVIRELDNLGLEVEEGIAGTGIVATLQGKGEGKTVLLRAEMDALPINEEADVFFKSYKPGVMHACGHDVHTANLLGVAKILASLKEEFDGTVKFMFQPGEEKGGGCKKMLEDKVLERHPVDMAMALHIMPIRAGEILISAGNITAYSDGFLIEVYGKSAHSSRPEEGIDAINIAAHIVVGLNSIISRKIDPRDTATLSVGTVEGGRSNNIISDHVVLRGIIRSSSEKVRNIIREQISDISKGIAAAYGGSSTVKINEGYPSIVNNQALTELITNSFTKNYMEFIRDIDDDIYRTKFSTKWVIPHRPLLTADDFAFIAKRVPSVYYMVGTGDHAPGHSSKFLVDEKYIKLCTRTMVLGALELLEVKGF